VIDIQKVCTKCGQTKSIFSFYKRTDHPSHASVCKACRAKYEKERYRYSAGKVVAHRRQQRYGISPQDLVAMFETQDFKCACCSDPLPTITKHVHIDHDHATNVIRGVVCRGCNLALAYGRDDPARLRAAADYLDRHAAQKERADGSQ
jgi:hypothetical protein